MAVGMARRAIPRFVKEVYAKVVGAATVTLGAGLVGLLPSPRGRPAGSSSSSGSGSRSGRGASDEDEEGAEKGKGRVLDYADLPEGCQVVPAINHAMRDAQVNMQDAMRRMGVFPEGGLEGGGDGQGGSNFVMPDGCPQQ